MTSFQRQVKRRRSVPAVKKFRKELPQIFEPVVEAAEEAGIAPEFVAHQIRKDLGERKAQR